MGQPNMGRSICINAIDWVTSYQGQRLSINGLCDLSGQPLLSLVWACNDRAKQGNSRLGKRASKITDELPTSVHA